MLLIGRDIEVLAPARSEVGHGLLRQINSQLRFRILLNSLEYLGQRIERTNQDAINSSALNFIDRVNALPLLSGDERAAEITSLLSMYNMLDATQKQFSEVADAYARLRAAGGVSYVVEATEPAAAEQSGSAGSYAWIAILAAVLAVACGAVLVICRKHTGRREK